MAEEQLQQFLHKVAQLQQFVSLTEAEPGLRAALSDCSCHHEVVELARSRGFEIGRRWGEASGICGGDDNLLQGACPPAGQESSRVLLESAGLRLELIHSCSAASAPGFWYDQPEHEWVTLLQGSARLQFEDEEQPRDLSRGDSLVIEPGRRHRLVSTDPAPGSLWLALFWCQQSDAD